MGHCIRAIIGSHESVRKLANDWVHAKEIRLTQGFGMIFCTIELLDDIDSGAIDEPDFPELDYFDTAVRDLMERYSFHTKLVYVETDYFGGIGTQAGVLYENGKIVIAPQSGEGTINTLLNKLGVLRLPDKDEFDTLGLGRYRHME